MLSPLRPPVISSIDKVRLMQYDPVKRQLGWCSTGRPSCAKLFYRLLDLLLLRAWHIHRELRAWARDKRQRNWRIYDAGAGFGQYTYWLSGLSRKWSITAIDVKDEQVADCNRFFQRIGRPQVTFEGRRAADHQFQRPLIIQHLRAGGVRGRWSTSWRTRPRCAAGASQHQPEARRHAFVIISTPATRGGSDAATRRARGPSSRSTCATATTSTTSGRSAHAPTGSAR